MKVQDIPIKEIRVIENHRLNAEDESIADLMQSIKNHGLKQPIGVSLNKDKKYELIFGNRRLIACQKLGWKVIQATVAQGMDIKQLMILNITENLQRKDPSFVEFGRVIQKLQKLGLTVKEISVRLGTDEKKIKMILDTYTRLPAKHRDKVQFLGKGHKQAGAIPAQVAKQLIGLKKSFGISDKNIDELVEYAGKGDVGKETLRNLAILLKTGIKFEDALEKMFDYEVYRIDFVANRLTVGKLVTEHQIGSAQVLFKRILYGKLPGIQQPDFVKI